MPAPEKDGLKRGFRKNVAQANFRMGWEKRGGRFYFYRKVREGRRAYEDCRANGSGQATDARRPSALQTTGRFDARFLARRNRSYELVPRATHRKNGQRNLARLPVG